MWKASSASARGFWLGAEHLSSTWQTCSQGSSRGRGACPSRDTQSLQCRQSGEEGGAAAASPGMGHRWLKRSIAIGKASRAADRRYRAGLAAAAGAVFDRGRPACASGHDKTQAQPAAAIALDVITSYKQPPRGVLRSMPILVRRCHRYEEKQTHTSRHCQRHGSQRCISVQCKAAARTRQRMKTDVQGPRSMEEAINLWLLVCLPSRDLEPCNRLQSLGGAIARTSERVSTSTPGRVSVS